MDQTGPDRTKPDWASSDQTGPDTQRRAQGEARARGRWGGVTIPGQRGHEAGAQPELHP